MREDLLHYIWQYGKFHCRNLNSSKGTSILIHEPGTHNKYSGPDFLSSKLEIDGQLWAGNVEMHINSSDWYAHGHQDDPAFSNVILHVVWNDDAEVIGSSGHPIPTLIIKDYVEAALMENYYNLFQKRKKSFINCEGLSKDIPKILLAPWYEHLYRERLEAKAALLHRYLKQSKGDWEESFFVWLLQGFGQQVNKASFLSLARAVDFRIFRRLATDVHQLESLLFGISGLLQKVVKTDPYHIALSSTYQFILNKYQLSEMSVVQPEFMGVRPSNFPTLRLSQFAVLYASQHHLFSKVIDSNSIKDIKALFHIGTTPYWNSHYTFGKKTKIRKKLISKNFLHSLIINSVLPAKYLFAKEHGEDNFGQIRNLIVALDHEKIGYISKFRQINFTVRQALDSQALLQLYNAYCVKNRCLECAIGNQILN